MCLLALWFSRSAETAGGKLNDRKSGQTRGFEAARLVLVSVDFALFLIKSQTRRFGNRKLCGAEMADEERSRARSMRSGEATESNL